MGNKGLILKKIKSKISPAKLNDSDLNQSISENIKDKSFVAAYLDYKVLIGKFEDKRLYFYDDESFEARYIQRLRVFNEDRELLIWRSSDGLKGRLRIDGEGDDAFVVDAEQVLFGTEAEDLKGFTRIREKRGTELILPISDLRIDDKKNRAFIKTRNYIGFNEDTHQAGYIDCRFVGLGSKAQDRG